MSSEQSSTSLSYVCIPVAHQSAQVIGSPESLVGPDVLGEGRGLENPEEISAQATQ